MNPYPVFSVREIEKQFPKFDKRRLVEWQQKDYIQKLRNRFYCFTDREVDESFLFYTANVLYHPSYISLESALAWYGIIPEGVFRTISCSTLKTQDFYTPKGSFMYHHIREKLFFGYRLERWGDHRFAMAEPEKSLIDYLYLHSEIRSLSDIESLRLNRIAIHERISLEKLNAYDSFIATDALSKRLSVLKEFLNA